MYKQIFTPPVDVNDDIVECLKDDVLMKRSAELTSIMIENKIKINTISAIVKEYITKYIYIKKNAPELLSTFTPKMWWITRGNKKST